MHYLSQHYVNFDNSAEAAMMSTVYPTSNSYATSEAASEMHDRTTETVCSNSNCVEVEDDGDNSDNDKDNVSRRNTGRECQYFFRTQWI